MIRMFAVYCSFVFTCTFVGRATERKEKAGKRKIRIRITSIRPVGIISHFSLAVVFVVAEKTREWMLVNCEAYSLLPIKIIKRNTAARKMWNSSLQKRKAIKLNLF